MPGGVCFIRKWVRERERERERERRNVFDKGSTTLDAVSPAFKFQLSLA